MSDEKTILMASMIVHLLEYIETGHPADLQAAESLSMNGVVYDTFKQLHNDSLLPLPRSPIAFLDRMLDA